MTDLDLAIVNVDCRPWNPSIVGIGIKEGKVVRHFLSGEVVRAATLVDGGGRTMLPGIDDSHLHGYEFGRSLTAIDVGASIAPTLAALRSALAQAMPEPSGWIRGIGWDDTVLRGSGPDGTLCAADIDEAVSGVPVILSDVTGHQALCNSAAMRLAGLDTEGANDPEGGRLVRFPDGTPTGLVYEAAVAQINASIPPLSQREQRAAILAAQRELLRQGVVAYTDPGLGPGAATLMDGTGDLGAIEAYQQLEASGELKLRVDLMLLFGGLGGTTAAAVRAGLDDFGQPMPMPSHGHLGIGQLKVFADGIPRSRTAWMSEPYDDCTHGSLTIAGDDDEARVRELHEIVDSAAARGWQVGLHTIGDRAIETVVDAIEGAKRHSASLRHYVIHGDFVADSDLIRMSKGGITLNANPSIRWAVGGRVAPIIGVSRNAQRQRLRTAWDREVNVCASSDAPVSPPDWRVIVAAAMTRAWRDDPKHRDEERLTAAEAIQSMTRNAAWQSGSETWRGSLALGQAADFILMEQQVDWEDPWGLPAVDVSATVIGGDVVFGELE